MAAVLDWGRPTGARVHLQADRLREAIRAASDEDGLPVLIPVPQ